MPLARCILCERSEKWAVALRRPLRLAGHRVYETRSGTDCWNEVVASPASLVGVEVTHTNLEVLVPWMIRFAVAFPAARVIVLGSRGLEAREWLLREAGAVHVVFSPRDWPPVVRIVRRHLGAAPGQGDSDRQRVWRCLPWAEFAD
jgi:DNA-binding response OmpR family regulator